MTVSMEGAISEPSKETVQEHSRTQNESTSDAVHGHSDLMHHEQYPLLHMSKKRRKSSKMTRTWRPSVHDASEEGSARRKSASRKDRYIESTRRLLWWRLRQGQRMEWLHRGWCMRL